MQSTESSDGKTCDQLEGVLRQEQPLRSIAIAGAWGYIGQRFLEASRALGLATYVYDPGPLPAGLDPGCFSIIKDESEFYCTHADVFHLALHPQHRRRGLEVLLERARQGEKPALLCEKPIALPEEADQALWALRVAKTPGMTLLYDFPELFDPMTFQIYEYLSAFKVVKIDEIWLRRSKDREDPRIARNYKVMVPIQYQETVHCFAFLLSLLGSVRAAPDVLWNQGVAMEGESLPYSPPNPQDYPYVVDGKCNADVVVAGVRVHVSTDFKAGSVPDKFRRIVGRGDGSSFDIEAQFLEGHKSLRINGQLQPAPVENNSYVAVLRQLWVWRQALSQEELNAGICPNAQTAYHAYLLSSLLWRACFTGREAMADSLNQAHRVAAEFAGCVKRFKSYSDGPKHNCIR